MLSIAPETTFDRPLRRTESIWIERRQARTSEERARSLGRSAEVESAPPRLSEFLSGSSRRLPGSLRRFAARQSFLLLFLGVFVSTVGPVTEASAQQEEDDPFAGIEEMVVVGSGTAAIFESQEVSTISFDAEYLEAIGAKDLGDIAQFTPNLEIRTPFAASNPTLFIRGVGLRDFNANSSSSVAVYNDEVYMNSPAAQLAQLFDVGDIGVLRGPQALEYGRNASAGTIRVIARQTHGHAGRLLRRDLRAVQRNRNRRCGRIRDHSGRPFDAEFRAPEPAPGHDEESLRQRRVFRLSRSLSASATRRPSRLRSTMPASIRSIAATSKPRSRPSRPPSRAPASGSSSNERPSRNG